MARTVCNTGRCFRISYHFYGSDLVHLNVNWVVLMLSQLCNHPTRLPTPSSGKSPHHRCHRMQNTSLFALGWFLLCQTGISTGKLKIYIIDFSENCAKNECNTMIIVPRRLKHPSCGENTPSDIAVTVNNNAEWNLSFIQWLLTP